MQTKVGVEFEIDFAHTLKGHPKCGKPHGHTAKIIVEAAGELKNGSTYEDNMVIEFDEMKRICWETLQRLDHTCLLYTSPSPRDGLLSRMPSSA